jgi:hypothetical protein
MLKSEKMKISPSKIFGLCFLALVSVAFILQMPSVTAAKNWNLTITVDKIRLVKAVDLWPGDKHGEIFFWYELAGVSNGYAQWTKAHETNPKSLEVGKSYSDLSMYRFTGLTDRYDIYLRMEVWDDDTDIYKLKTDDYLIGYPNVGENHRSFWFFRIWGINYVQIVPGQPATFTVRNSVVQVQFKISWSQ